MTIQLLDPQKIASLKRHQKRAKVPLEKTIERKVCDYAKSIGLANRKYNTVGHQASPDRVFLPGNRLVFFIEFKRPGGKPTPAQEREHERLRELGYDVYVIDNVQEGIRVVDAWYPMT